MSHRPLRVPILCVITDGATEAAVARVEKALAGGTTMVQLRCAPQTEPAQIIRAGKKLLRLTRNAQAPLIINDHVALVEPTGADGVHLGQRDMPPREARAILGAGRIVGYSVSDVSQLDSTAEEAVDYLGAGPVFATASKPDANRPIGLEGLRKIIAAARRPVLGIGGITEIDVAAIASCGAAGIAVIGMLEQAPDPAALCRKLLETLRTRAL